MNELKELDSSLVQMDKGPVFSVPDGYFDSFPELLWQKIAENSAASPLGVAPVSPIEDVDLELQALSPLLAGLRGKNPLKVPEGYFDQPDSIAGAPEGLSSPRALPSSQTPLSSREKVVALEGLPSPQEKVAALEGPPSSQKRAKVVSMDRAGQRKNIFYAAASIVAILGLFSLFFALSNNEKAAAEVDIAAELPKLPDAEIKAFLWGEDDVLVMEPVQGPSLAGLEDLALEDLIKDVKDAELQQFIIDNPELLPGKIN